VSYGKSVLILLAIGLVAFVVNHFGRGAPSGVTRQDPVGFLKSSSSHESSIPNEKENSSRGSGWKYFNEKFGPHLKAEFSNDGRLVSIRGTLGGGHPADRKFRSENSQMAIERAQEILKEAGNLIGIRADWPLAREVARGNRISAQVFFTEMYQGVPLAPVGSVKVDLGSRGELLALDSDYVPQVDIRNEVLLSPEQAQKKAGVPVQSNAEEVIWVTGKEGYYAFQFLAQGYQVLVDAQTGRVLVKRDIRQF